ACLSVFRPITWVLSAYMEAESKTNRLMILEVAKVGVLVAGIVALQSFGVRAAAGAVGLAFGLTAVAGGVMVRREGPSPRRLLVGFLQPLAACAVMAAAVWAVHAGLLAMGWDHPGLLLGVMSAAGAIAYVAAALVLCRESARDLLSLLKKALKRG